MLGDTPLRKDVCLWRSQRASSVENSLGCRMGEGSEDLLWVGSEPTMEVSD